MFCSAAQVAAFFGWGLCCGVVADRCLAVQFLKLQLDSLRIFCALEQIIVLIQKKEKVTIFQELLDG